jgi:UDP-2-acetamido-2-deoxy-ribo-hexuluronate aminotransferase
MQELLLSSDIVADACLNVDNKARLAAERAAESGRAWVYTACGPHIHGQLVDSLAGRSRQQVSDPQVLQKQAADLLSRFMAGKNWLPTLSEDMADCGCGPPSSAQLLLALSRLGEDAQFITDDLSLLEAVPRSMTSAQFLAAVDEQIPSIDFIDLKTQQDRIRPDLERRMTRVLQHGRYIMGPEVAELEDVLGAYVGVKHCIAVASGTDSLLIAMMALGIGPGDEVITVPYAWISTAEMIALLGARPVFVDIDPHTFNLDPELLEAAITPRTKAIMPVSIYGQCPEFDSINEISAQHGLPVIEDAAQSFGASYRGRRSCGLSTIGSTSFFPSKPLGCYGDGGALFTENDDLAERMRQIRVHGQRNKHEHTAIGVNGRLDTLQAAVVLAKMQVFDAECQARRRVAREYRARLTEFSEFVQLPFVPKHNESVYAQYTVLVGDRDRVRQALSSESIPSMAYYILPLHLQPAFTSLNQCRGDFPVAEQIAEQCLSLPMSPWLSTTNVQRIAAALKRAVGESSGAAKQTANLP